MMKSLAFMSVALLSTSSASSIDCANPPYNSCEFYSTCFESVKPCGATGYALGYGGHYCEKFLALNGDDQWNTWTRAVGQCLQENLVPLLTTHAVDSMTCDQIHTFAFDSHPHCYTDNGVLSVCKLSLGNKAKILQVVAPGDLINGEAVKQELAVLKSCLVGHEAETERI